MLSPSPLLKIPTGLSSPTQGSLKCRLRPAASAPPGNLLEMQIPWLCPRPPESEARWGRGPELCLNTPSGDPGAGSRVRTQGATEGGTDRETEAQSRAGPVHRPRAVKCHSWGWRFSHLLTQTWFTGYTLVLLLPAAHHKVRGLPSNARWGRHYWALRRPGDNTPKINLLAKQTFSRGIIISQNTE